MKAPTLWIDVTELFGQFALSSHPTGISRVMINLVDALAADPGVLFEKVRPIFWHPVWRLPLAFDYTVHRDLAAFFPSLRNSYAESGWEVPRIRSGLRKGIMTSVPEPFRFRLFPYLHGVTHFLGWARHAGIGVHPVVVSRNDRLFVPGSFWLDGYAPRLAAHAKSNGATVGVFVHDVLLLSNPEWLAPGHAQQFRRGVEAFLPHCSVVACNSTHTRNELRNHVSLPASLPIEVCRLADARIVPPATQMPREVADLSGRHFALFVSTLTPRKNHRLLVDAWLQLHDILGAQTPALVFVGGGAPDAALGEVLARAAKHGVPVIRLDGVDDAALETLYDNAWITLYPSLGEGYGMPVAEALARGKVCLATQCGGLADVAPDLIDAIDPQNPNILVERIVSYHKDPKRLAAREAQVRARYRPTQWADTARCVRLLLEQAVRAVH
jgi:glycosyltransferase involved in cell wall biosynthesis